MSTTLHILYGTQTGNAERLAFQIARLALKRGVASVTCRPADTVPIAEWSVTSGGTGAAVLFVCSNANQGEAPNTFRQTWGGLLDPGCARLEGLRYAVFGLGDSLYPKFNYIPKMLHNRLRQLGAEPLLLRGLGDESDARGLGEALLPWLMELWAALGLPGADTAQQQQQQAEENTLEAPLFSLMNTTIVSGSGGVSSDNAASAAEDDASGDVYAEPTVRMRLDVSRALTAADHFQEVRHLELSFPDTPGGIDYAVGDALGVYCLNAPEQTTEFLRLAGLSGQEVVVVTPDTTHGVAAHTPRPYWGRAMTVRALLRRYVDLEAPAPADFLWMLAEWVRLQGEGVTDGDGAAAEARAEVVERLLELASYKFTDEYLSYAYREKRSVCEVLQDFGHVLRGQGGLAPPPLGLLLTFAPPMLPRYFSLASSPLLDGRHTAHLCVARLAWTTPLKRQRAGLCSSALTAAAVGDTFPCFVWQGSLVAPESGQRVAPLCIATGSGIAPIRSLIRECVALRDAGSGGGEAEAAAPAPSDEMPVKLFFGCRNRDKDFLYGDEWEELRGSGALPGLEVVPAFSRDGEKKIYVQHQLGARARMVGGLLTDADRPVLVYVCGNAKQMPKDVRQALDDIAAAVTSPADGEALMKAIVREGRYQVDTWSA